MCTFSSPLVYCTCIYSLYRQIPTRDVGHHVLMVHGLLVHAYRGYQWELVYCTCIYEPSILSVVVDLG